MKLSTLPHPPAQRPTCHGRTRDEHVLSGSSIVLVVEALETFEFAVIPGKKVRVGNRLVMCLE